MITKATSELIKILQVELNDPDFIEHELVEQIVSCDLTHQHYLLLVLYTYYFGVGPESVAAREAFNSLVIFHKSIQEIFNSDLIEEQIYEGINLNSYVQYLDNGVQYSNDFDEKRVEQFKSKCERRRNLRWRAA